MTWIARNGICTDAPAPMPTRSWYPIHIPALECIECISIPQPTVNTTAPAYMHGA